MFSRKDAKAQRTARKDKKLMEDKERMRANFMRILISFA